MTTTTTTGGRRRRSVGGVPLLLLLLLFLPTPPSLFLDDDFDGGNKDARLFSVFASSSSSSANDLVKKRKPFSSSSKVFLFARAEEEAEEMDDDDAMIIKRKKKKNKKKESNIEQTHGDTGEIIVEDLTDPKNFDERRGDLRSTHQMFDENGYVVGTSSSFHGDGDDVTHIEDLQEIGRSVDDIVDDGGPAIPKHYVCNACQASARKLDADLSDEEFKRARGAKYGKKLEEMYYLDAIEKSCDDHAHWHLYHAHVYDSGYHYLAGPLLGNASKRGSKPFVRDFSKHRWPKRLRDYCQVLVNEFDEEGVYAKHYELQQEKLAWEEEKRKEEEEEAELEKTMTEEEYRLRRKKKRREEILHPHKRRKKRKSFDLAKKLCYQTDPPKCTFDTEFKKRAFLQLATHEEEEQAKKSQHLGWDEREGVIGGIRYERTDPEKAKKASETFSSSSSASSAASAEKNEKKNKKKNKKKTKNERQHAETKDEL
jgi:hypothetical protein